MQLNGLRLNFTAVHDIELRENGTDAYMVELLNYKDEHLLRFRLPAELIERAVLSNVRSFLAMSPDGWVSMQFDNLAEELPGHPRMAIDALIEQVIAPPMLEDEPAIDVMLEELCSRLKRAMAAVETAIANLQKE